MKVWYAVVAMALTAALTGCSGMNASLIDVDIDTLPSAGQSAVYPSTIDPAITERLKAVGDAEPIAVSIWLYASPFGEPSRPDPGAGISYEEYEVLKRQLQPDAMRTATQATQPFVAKLAELGYAGTAIPGAPLVHVRLPGSGLRKVGTWPEVAHVYLDGINGPDTGQ